MTVAPVSLGGRVSTGAMERIKSDLFALGWSPGDLTATETAILSSGTRLFTRQDARLYVPPIGHAVLVFSSIADCNAVESFDVHAYLADRRTRHRQLVDAPHRCNGEVYLDVTNCIHQAAARELPRHRRRPDLGVHHITYAMTVQFIQSDARTPQELGQDDRKVLSLLLRPSSARMEDSPYALAPDQHNAQTQAATQQYEHDFLAEYPDLDCGIGTMVFASWAAVVVVGRIDDEITDLIRALEVRLQSSWATADYIVQVSASALDQLESGAMTTRQLEWMAVELRHVGNLVEEKPDAMASDRVAAIADGLSDTSGHNVKWQSAHRAMDHLQQVASLVRSDRSRATGLALEAFLLVFALAQLAPIVLDLPINSMDKLGNQTSAVTALVLTLALLVILAIRRSR